MGQTNNSSNLTIIYIYWPKQSFSGSKSQDFLHDLLENYFIRPKNYICLISIHWIFYFSNFKFLFFKVLTKFNEFCIIFNDFSYNFNLIVNYFYESFLRNLVALIITNIFANPIIMPIFKQTSNAEFLLSSHQRLQARCPLSTIRLIDMGNEFA